MQIVQQIKSMSKAHQWLLMILLILHVAIVWIHCSQQDLTYDEGGYGSYAMRWAQGHPERTETMDDSKSPVVLMWMVPRAVQQIVQPNYHTNDFGKADRLHGRYMMVIFSLLIALYVFRFCFLWFGKRAWIFAFLLLLFDPLFIAYAGIITSDMAVGFFLLATLFHFYAAQTFHQRKDYAWFVFFLGMSLVAKQSMLFLPMVLLLMQMLRWMYYKTKIKLAIKSFFVNGFIIAAAVLLLINLCYYFKQSFVPLDQFVFKSSALQHLQQTFAWLKWMPVPLPHNYVDSIDLLQFHSEVGGGGDEAISTYPGVWLLGEYKNQSGFWYYYLINLIVKLPLATWVMIIIASFVGTRNLSAKSFMQKQIYSLLPLIFFLLIISLFNKFQIGIRHALFLYPLVMILVAGSIEQFVLEAKWKKYLISGLFVYLFVSVGTYFPNLIPYTNELLWNKQNVFRHINDSGIDYGQSEWYLKDYLKVHPEIEYAPEQPTAGKFIVRITHLCNWWKARPNHYLWLWSFQPSDHYKHAFLIYEISNGDLQKAGLR
jgi:Dolichyl-phosphate-mannose-protein mannosyltransferase